MKLIEVHATKKGGLGLPFSLSWNRRLERRIDFRECGRKVRTNSANHRDNRNSDQRGDQAIFNGGRAGV